MRARPCPVHGGVPSKMTRESFIRGCLLRREKAKRHNSANTESLVGFSSNNKSTCSDCKIGHAIEQKRSFKPPKEVTFVKFKEIGNVVAASETPHRKRYKLNMTKVRRIRYLASSGTPVRELAEEFSVHVNTIKSVIAFRTWKAL